MRDREIVVISPRLAVDEQVQIDAPRPPPYDGRRTSHPRFDRLQRSQQFARRELRQQSGGGIDEFRLVLRPKRRGTVQA